MRHALQEGNSAFRGTTKLVTFPDGVGAAAWAASFGLMALGHRTGRLGKNASALDPRLIACAAFATLGFQQLADAVGGGGR